MKTDITHAWEFGGALTGLPPAQAWPVLFAVFGAAVLLAWLSYRFAVVVPGRPQRALLVALRAAVFAALLLCLANPVRITRTLAEPPVQEKTDTGPAGRLAVVVDRSDSMTAPDNRGRSRLDGALAAWRRFGPAAHPVYAETCYYSFADGLKPAASLEEALARTGGTDRTHLFSALSELLRLPAPERPAAVVVLTDGVDNSGEPDSPVRDAAREAGVPVYFIAGANRDRSEPFLRVREFGAPGEVLRRSEFLVQASFEAFSREDRGVAFSLWRGGERVDGGTLALNTGSNLIPWSFRLTAGEPGPVELSLKIEDGPAARVAARARVAVVGQRPVNVVVYQGALDWGLGYLTNALRTDPGFKLLTVVNPRLGVNISGGQDGDAIVGLLSDKAAALRSADCIVLARLYPAQLTAAQQQALVDFAREGGAVLFTQPDPLAAGQFRGSIIEQLLPVQFDGTENGPVARSALRSRLGERLERRRAMRPELVTFSLTEAGRASPVFARAGAAGEGSVLAPKFAEHAPATRVRAGSEVLAWHPGAVDPQTGRPHVLLATQTFGRGRTAMLTTDGLWRWKMSEPSQSRAVETFWQQLVLAIGRRAEREPLRFVDMPPQVAVGETAMLRIAGADADHPPVVTVRAVDGRSGKLTPRPTGDAAAPWRISWKATVPGEWELVAEGEGGAPASLFLTAAEAPAGEFARTPPAVELMRSLAASTGGALLADKLPPAWRPRGRDGEAAKPAPVEVETRRLRWNTWPLLGAALGFYAAELILRRVWKLL